MINRNQSRNPQIKPGNTNAAKRIDTNRKMIGKQKGKGKGSARSQEGFYFTQTDSSAGRSQISLPADVLPLPDSFGRRGFHFAVLRRSSSVVLLEKWRTPRRRESTEPACYHCGYEVVILHIRPLRTYPGGRVSGAREALPAPSQWGWRGWTYKDLDSAVQRFDLLITLGRGAALPLP